MTRLAIPRILCCAMLLAAGCAVQGRPFEKAAFPPNHAVIYVYRPYNYAGSLLRPAVDCGGQSSNIGPGGYHPFIVPAGKVVCSVAGSESADQVEILAEPRTYYIKEGYAWGILGGHPHLDPIDTDIPHDEIQSCVLEP
ncbi:MAG: hypothetical protein ACYDC3_19890 [Candidatus Binataceae bacterium]